MQVCSPCWEACPNPGCTSVCSAPCNLLPACGPDVRRCSRMLTCSNGHRVRCPSIAGLPCPAKLFCLTCAKEGLPEEVSFSLCVSECMAHAASSCCMVCLFGMKVCTGSVLISCTNVSALTLCPEHKPAISGHVYNNASRLVLSSRAA